ncbi:NLP/P60 protein [Janibacter hoylei PVAS-1]|uniref:NLP/P60 protein n=1 Tax=Janibacter hoylei PVAS-1 TaxID=1210046 RepID=K1DYG0_9MICO|nr:C40 family peptidase [Janibacter hoylei]EKA61449.1 NLP/P60 protein [Janibacter hoylei PVAS-1]
MSHNVGRHRAAGRYNPVSELGQIVSQAGTPLAKGSAVIAASGGLIAAIAIPAQAADSTAEVDAAPVQTASAPAAPAAAVTAPATTTSSKATDAAFGKIEVEPVAKPTGPTPAQLRARAEREQARQEAAAERQREQEQEQAAREEQASERTESTAPSRSQERQAPAPAKSEPAPAAASSASSDVISIAKQYIGVPYVYGGSTPSGFDCSGFTQYVFAKAGKSLPRVTTAQQAAATPVSNPQPGDLVFFGSPSWHVGIYVGDGMMIDAPRTGKSISIRPIFDGVSGYGRV